MAPQSKKKLEDSFIEPFSPYDKHADKSAAQHALDLHGNMSADDARKNALMHEEFLKNPSKAFSKSFLQSDAHNDTAMTHTPDTIHDDANKDLPENTPALTDTQSTNLVRGDWTQALAAQDPLAEYVLLIGAGHLSREVAHLAHYAGFIVDVMDMRKDYVQETRFPHARRTMHCPNYANISEVYEIGARHFIVILSHTYETDLLTLSHLVHSEARYIGLAGTARKQEQLFAELRKTGIPDTELACVSCPIGVDIGAESPQEMAISIVAELVAARAGRLVPHVSRRA